MKNNYQFFSIFFFVLITTRITAQEIVVPQFETIEYMLEISDKAYLKNKSAIEREISTHYKYGESTEHLLPLVFHIVRTPTMPKISKQQVNSQINALNRDFNSLDMPKSHPNDPKRVFSQSAKNPEIQFCLASKDETNNATNAIQSLKVQDRIFENYNDLKQTKKGGITAWDTKKYINVWVTDLKDNQAGYAQMPGAVAKYDGIVIDYEYFGTMGTAKFPYDEGKTLTHLMGNYLGLLPLWGKFKCGDDAVDDTPIHNSPNFSCPESDHVTTCDGYETEMTMNFMDATYDACRYMFTEGQIKRMQAALSESGFRSGLTKTATQCAQERPEEPKEVEGEVATKIYEPEKLIHIIPNPAKDRVYINFENMTSEDRVQMTARDASGKVVFQNNIPMQDQNNELDISNWFPGIYFLSFQFDGQVKTKKLIVQ